MHDLSPFSSPRVRATVYSWRDQSVHPERNHAQLRDLPRQQPDYLTLGSCTSSAPRPGLFLPVNLSEFLQHALPCRLRPHPGHLQSQQAPPLLPCPEQREGAGAGGAPRGGSRTAANEGEPLARARAPSGASSSQVFWQPARQRPGRPGWGFLRCSWLGRDSQSNRSPANDAGTARCQVGQLQTVRRAENKAGTGLPRE